MHKWKYKLAVVKMPTFAQEEEKLSVVENKLTRFGMDGWELVQVVTVPGHNKTHLYMKQAY